jgi:hypothetical protein
MCILHYHKKSPVNLLQLSETITANQTGAKCVLAIVENLLSGPN